MPHTHPAATGSAECTHSRAVTFKVLMFDDVPVSKLERADCTESKTLKIRRSSVSCILSIRSSVHAEKSVSANTNIYAYDDFDAGCAGC